MIRDRLSSKVSILLLIALSTTFTISACSKVNADSRFSATNKTVNHYSDIGYDAILGARGCSFQLVLITVFHMGASPGNIPWSLYQAVKKDKRVQFAVPYAVGDNYLGYRLVGTTKDTFTELKLRLKVGRQFKIDVREAVVGSYAAQKTGLKVGSTFQPYHGLTFNKNMQHKEVYTVVGVVKATNTPIDRVIWIPLNSFYRMDGHVLRDRKGKSYIAKKGRKIPDKYKEVSAVLIKFKSKISGFFFRSLINRQGKVATLAWPIPAVIQRSLERNKQFEEMSKLYNYQ